MVTKIRFLDKSGDEDEPGDWETLHAISGAFLEPECYAYAIGLSRALGWPICGLMKGGIVEHAVVKSPEGLLDYRGIAFTGDDAELGAPFSLGVPYEIRIVYESDLLAIRPVLEHDIKLGQTLAEALFPEYPWPNPASRRMRCFAEELEALSRKHGIWIRASVPGQRPILSFAAGGEAGYDLSVLMDGQQCSFDRRLE